MVENEIITEYKQHRIIDAAQKRFAHYGLEKTTMNEIADDLGISKAALYYYFKDKESLFKEVVLKEQKLFCGQMDKLMSSGKKIDIMLRKYAEKRAEYLRMLLNLGKMRYEAFNASKPLFVALGKTFHDKEKKLIDDMLKAAMERKEIAKLDVDEHSDFFLNVLRAIRLYELEKKELWEQGKIDEQIKKQYLQFTNMFLKSIENR